MIVHLEVKYNNVETYVAVSVFTYIEGHFYFVVSCKKVFVIFVESKKCNHVHKMP